MDIHTDNMDQMTMRGRGFAAWMAAAALVVAAAGCRHTEPIHLSPDAMRELVLPSPADTQADVAALNGEPQAREQVHGMEFWVYARTRPAVPGLGSRTAMIWFREGRVVRVETMGGFSAPYPTFPVAAATAGEALDASAGAVDGAGTVRR